MKTKIFFYIGILILILSCDDTAGEAEGRDSFECNYSFLENLNSRETNKSGSKISVDVALKANLRKVLAGSDISVQIGDTSFIDLARSEFNSSQVYTVGFMERHNAIVGMLCALEKELLDSINTGGDKGLLENEIRSLRNRYLDLLLIEEQSEDQKSRNTSTPKAEPINAEFRKATSKREEIKVKFVNHVNASSDIKEYLYRYLNSAAFNQREFQVEFSDSGILEKVKAGSSLYRYSGGYLQIHVSGVMCPLPKEPVFFIERNVRSGDDLNNLQARIKRDIDSILVKQSLSVSKTIKGCMVKM